MKTPNFLIVGGPKCGTTALSEYLRWHPHIFMSSPKEPHYFGADVRHSVSPDYATFERYAELFAAAGPEHLAVGEASTMYLSSATAIQEIAEMLPGARLIVMVRNPVETVASMHAEFLYTRVEDRRTVEEAWRLQAARARGESIPKVARTVPVFLQYGSVARFGEQLRRVYKFFPREQVKVVVVDDMRRDTGAVYREILHFLRVPNDGRQQFPRLNESKQHRFKAVGHLTNRAPGGSMSRLAEAAKRTTGLEPRHGWLGPIRRLNRVARPREPLSPTFAAELVDYFREDIGQLGELIGRDLTHWYRYSPTSP